MRVIAKDQIGNEFPKEVFSRAGAGFNLGQKIISFGWPVEYIAAKLLEDYPYNYNFCIDVTGRNHKGSSVTISAEQMNAICEKFVKN